MKKVIECDRCGSTNDVVEISINDVPKKFCVDCRTAIFTKKRGLGRPSLGVTKKVSLTLPEDEWEELDEKAEGNRSKFIRKIVIRALDSDMNMDGKVYFKSDLHKEQTEKILEKFGQKSLSQNIEYGLFAYVVGATYKAENVLKTINDENFIDIDKLHEIINSFSTSERVMIRFSLQLFNSSIDDIKLSDVMYSLDSENVKVIKQAIELRY